MDIPFTVDLPPVPDCFSKLLSDEDDSSALDVQNQPWREAERLRELRDIMLKSLAQNSVPETPMLINGNDGVSALAVINFHGGSGDAKREWTSEHEADSESETERTLVQLEPSDHHDVTESKPGSSFCRLNTALDRLKREMVDLRHLDMSLFCQLLSLNEAIQDFKISINDRYSEYTGSEYTCSEYTGSEYSFGEGMGSRVGSFSSLNDENDWNRDFRGGHDDPDSPVSTKEASEERSSADDLAASTSSFLQQIKDLTMRVETDF